MNDQFRIAVIILIATFLAVLMATRTPNHQLSSQTPPATKSDINQINKQLRNLKKQNIKLNNQLQEIRQHQTSTKTPPWLKEQSNSRSFYRLLIVNRGGHMIDRLDNYLANSPLANQGRTIYLAAVDNKVDPRLIVAIATVESSKGKYLAGNYNAWGRKTVRGGWENWSSWEAAINNQAQYLARWGNKVWTVYCVPPEPWTNKVKAEMAKV